jgi:hypothetical protein
MSAPAGTRPQTSQNSESESPAETEIKWLINISHLGLTSGTNPDPGTTARLVGGPGSPSKSDPVDLGHPPFWATLLHQKIDFWGYIISTIPL